MTRAPLLLGLVFVLVACGGGDDVSAPSPDELIAFSSNRGGDFDIYVMRPDGSGVRLLTRDRPQGRLEADDYDPPGQATAAASPSRARGITPATASRQTRSTWSMPTAAGCRG
jgi:Tol biopolymer transport system component